MVQNLTPQHRLAKFLDENQINYYGFGGNPINYECGYPPNSPDMNPIELIFGILEEGVSKRHPQTISELKEIVEEEWEKITIETIRKCFKRLQKVMPYVSSHKGDIYFEK